MPEGSDEHTLNYIRQYSTRILSSFPFIHQKKNMYSCQSNRKKNWLGNNYKFYKNIVWNSFTYQKNSFHCKRIDYIIDLHYLLTIDSFTLLTVGIVSLDFSILSRRNKWRTFHIFSSFFFLITICSSSEC
jgi:hypothetical protein